MRYSRGQKGSAETLALGLGRAGEGEVQRHEGEQGGIALGGAQALQEALFVGGVHGSGLRAAQLG